ncbi:MAG TPA: hypothetical protein VNT42_01520, partial [Sphingomonas sp.]|nr:hypothetical protein [Sphingomonas sp.]
DNQIDATTGTVKAKGRFPNPGGKLFPNQFVNVNLLVDTLRAVPAIPVTAVRHGTQGDFVFVLQAENKVKMQIVKQGPANGANVAILSGLKVGQTVITEGADNLEDRSKVMLPGERPQRQPRAKSGWFGWLFGSSESATRDRRGDDRSGGGNSTAPGGERRRHRQGAGGDQ